MRSDPRLGRSSRRHDRTIERPILAVQVLSDQIACVLLHPQRGGQSR